MKYLITLLLLISSFAFSQVKVGGHIIDEQGEPIPFANIIFKGSTEGGVSDENGKFYIESESTYTELMISFLGFETKIISLKARNFDIKIVLKEDTSALDEVMVYSGKTKKKGNPAVEILKKIWAKKRQNGLRLYKQYEYDKYEKIEFDLNNIDEKFKKKRLFKGMEFVFEKIDNSIEDIDKIIVNEVHKNSKTSFLPLHHQHPKTAQKNFL